ncbi:cupin domain-containing protein [Candidatus Uhrbacteria bacterium CG_4_9_14_0_2_um_filter_41_50]|uniref:Cupin domain-containing protein n=1 Tax=Candidatus Uhrbacteria bacterium CG_4_9_14_0_2_um_filter_41_50 TaxID=1975031 RepID=A0A2M8ENM5_9BACT|nr:MAG: cupin domain-containing protein [Candidatus Uhrbacteria bacterium CG_4_10_14_3_um_filter_41_21]PIZ54244.1 MAG: cupin domain-containing protein [Candidatus Uhrbacteria bacterium CG_4_10_14_0_2_um_filter_41_21]PJB84414.1 MAG: cupin domain-containing protein [Candidatus Uhrbacteria bacterium CG_4_9_14_0_8_um_filter_41_16]PJC24353.1 MAG: cupin domain-containing protein [Candidatus Uhrbacteria bacterium CG_4_9_14_0_2_um_filter_41_50]PJE75284.1 MAG: cupin domain-containing protein [Candidatus
MKSYHINLELETLKNEDYRRVLFTGPNTQLVLMALSPGVEIGTEHHTGHDQFIRVEAGSGKAILDGEEIMLADGSGLVITAGTEHNIINTSETETMKLYTLYSPPEHPDGTVQSTKADEIAH